MCSSAPFLSPVSSQNPLHTDYGFLRLGRSLWSANGIVDIHDDSLVVTREGFRRRDFILPRASITRLTVEQPFWFMFSGGLRIEHTISSYPSLLFYSRDIEVLTVQLQQHGFRVSNSDA
jgi:hypothetical protein